MLEGSAASPPNQGHQEVEQTMAQGFPRLVFPKALEERFLRRVQNFRFLVITVAGLASVVLFTGMLVADALMTPDVLGLSTALRLGVYAPLTLLTLYILHKLRRPVLTEWLVAGGGMLACALTVLIALSSSGRWALPRVVELNMIVVYICAFARFWPAVSLTVVVALAHAFMFTLLHDDTGILAANSSLLLATTIGFALYGNYTLEHDERMAFLLDLREKALDAELQATHDRLARMATTDALTDLANRRYFEDFLAESAQRAREEGRALSLVLVDIDHFKPYNDHHGHQAGDKCLVAVAQALSTCMRRPLDLVARWGGEEFAVVMSDADLAAAALAAERIRRTVQALALPHGAPGCAPVVTVSVGVACCPPGQAIALPDLIHRADMALYRAKAQGRNQVCQDGQP